MISLRNVSFRYSEDDPWVLQDISLEIPQGQLSVIIGPNGSGKSTLAELITGLLEPSSGNILVGGLDTREHPPHMRGRVGLVFQNPEHQFFHTTVAEDVAFGPQNLGLSPEEVEKRTERVLREVGLWDLAQENPMNLSWGQKQLVAIAGILAMEPACLILDEPTSMLDPPSKKAVRSLIRRFRDRTGCTVLWITQDMEELVGAQRVIVLNRGRIAFDGGWKELLGLESLLQGMGFQRPTALELVSFLEKRGLVEEAHLLLFRWEELLSW
jgi:energy-coupling factor transport system ATP-binding protein